MNTWYDKMTDKHHIVTRSFGYFRSGESGEKYAMVQLNGHFYESEKDYEFVPYDEINWNVKST